MSAQISRNNLKSAYRSYRKGKKEYLSYEEWLESFVMKAWRGGFLKIENKK